MRFHKIPFKYLRLSQPIWAHILGLSTLCGMYIGWAYIGKIITGTYVYFFFNFQEIGWEYALLSVGSFVGLTNICDFPNIRIY